MAQATNPVPGTGRPASDTDSASVVRLRPPARSQPPEAGSVEEAGHGGERLRSVLAHAPVALFEIDGEGRYVLAEGRGLPSLGREVAGLLGRSALDLHRDEPAFLEPLRRAFAGEKVRQLVPLGGSVLDVSLTPLRGGAGGAGPVERVIGVACDVSEPQRLRRTARESAARLRDFAAASSAWLWETDHEHRFTFVGEQCREALALEPGDFVGRRRADLRATDPAEGDWDEHLRALDGRRPFRDFVHGVAARDGRRRLVSACGVPVFEPDGSFVGFRGTARDVTRPVEAEERLRASEGRFRSLVTNMRDIVFRRGVAGPGGTGYDEGGVELLGADAERLAGNGDGGRRAAVGTWYAAIHPEDLPRYVAAERRRRDRLEPYSLEYRIAHSASGEPRWVREVAWVVSDEAAGRTYFDSYIVDVTELKRTAEALRQSQERHRQLVESAPVGILVYRKGRCAFANPKAAALLGARDPRDLLGRPLADLAGPEDGERLRREARELLRGRPAAAAAGREMRCRRLDGATVPADVSMVPIVEAGEPAVQLVLVDATARERAEASVRHMALHDALTGLPNRTLLLERLGGAIAAAQRSGRPVALLVLDLDGFREINDTLGHAVGDELLREVARRVRGVVREGDTLARLGGDEFAIVQPSLGSAADAEAFAARVIDAIGQPFRLGGHPVRAGVSLGVSLYPGDAASPGALLQNADLALDSAKSAGRNRCRFYERGMDAAARARRQLAADLRAAVEQEALGLVFQPLVAVKTGAVVGVEALVRWQHPGLGAVPPAEFIPIAESTGLIRALGGWVLERACAEARAWSDRGRGISVSVNVSAAQLRDADFADRVAGALQRHGLSPGQLCLELTESLLIDPRLDGIGALLDRLDRLGVRMAIDDFGTGYSSLLNLTRLPVHHIKVDRSFVSGIGGNADSEAIVRATVKLAHSLGKRVVAEGVETDAQHRFLRRLGCDEAQGFLYGRPMAAEAVPRQRPASARARGSSADARIPASAARARRRQAVAAAPATAGLETTITLGWDEDGDGAGDDNGGTGGRRARAALRRRDR